MKSITTAVTTAVTTTGTTATQFKRGLGPLALAALVAVSAAAPAHASAILFINDSKGQNGQAAWLTSLSALAHTTTYMSISADGNPAANLAAYDAVIWSNGDAAYSNLTSDNVATLTTFLDGGGHLLYGGGHSLYEESHAQAFIQTYLGVSAYPYNMPMFQNCGATAATSGAIGPVALQCSSTGQYGSMLTAFNADGVTELLSLEPGNMDFAVGSHAIAALHDGGSYRAATWGFDLNHVVTAERTAVLGATLDRLLGNSVPEPTTLALSALALAALALRSRRA